MKISKGLIIKNKYNGTWLILAKEKLEKGNRSIKVELMSLIDRFVDDILQ